MANEHLATPPVPNSYPRTSPEFAYFANVETLAATGSTQADAAPIVTASGGFVTLTAADGTKGVVLPPSPTAGYVIEVKNVDNAVMKVYPATGGTINVLSANAAISLAARVTAKFVATSSTQWYTMPLLPS